MRTWSMEHCPSIRLGRTTHEADCGWQEELAIYWLVTGRDTECKLDVACSQRSSSRTYREVERRDKAELAIVRNAKRKKLKKMLGGPNRAHPSRSLHRENLPQSLCTLTVERYSNSKGR